MVTIYAVFKTAPRKGDLALAIFTDARNAHNFASQYRGSTVDEWQVSNADFLTHEGYPDDAKEA